ncbi:hypothetical protein [Parasulfitobacter algicola]|uniref:Uncharacterized protein n=1 Tax=Parasulfitobacter algicola TaxID=2614809 RepID=A0ABX2IZR3_9RHOB|nr:hypothetical protein [Sulfitobacter algicola]NSX56782.1 hypothetical protein [Sulfitobacter algicola]
MDFTPGRPKFDWDLDTSICDKYTNATLTITLRLGLRQINPSNAAETGTYKDSNGNKKKIEKWDQAKWMTWKHSFITSAKRYWDDKFCLLNVSGKFFRHEVDGKQYSPNIDCRFKLIEGNADQSSRHHIVDVVYLREGTSDFFRSHSKLYDNRDIYEQSGAFDSKGRPVVQKPNVHEIGHLLGLNHVDVGKSHCPTNGNPNADPCYGVADEDLNSIMGAGMQLRLACAKPWLKALDIVLRRRLSDEQQNSKPRDLKQSDFAGRMQSLSMWEARMQCLYPRTAQEVDGGIIVTTPR